MILPHKPYVATPDVPGVALDRERLMTMMAYADKMVAKVIRTLGEESHYEEAIVVYNYASGLTTGYGIERRDVKRCFGVSDTRGISAYEKQGLCEF